MSNRSNPTAGVYEFGPFRLDVEERLFSKDGEPVPLMPKSFDLLALLVRNSNHLLDKNELLNQVWPDSFVEESNLAQNIYLLRQALANGSHQECSIETVRGRGYRFNGNVVEILPDRLMLTAPDQASLAAMQEASLEKGLPRISSSPGRLQVRTFTLAAIALAAIALASGVYFLFSRDRAPVACAKSIAVLPFKPLGIESNDELLGLGMADAMIIRLSNLQQIPVLPTSAIFKYTGRETDPLAAGRELGVEAVLDGTFQHAGDRVRVTAQLLNVSDGKLIWSDKFDEKFSDIFAVQDSISERMAIALALKISGDERKLLRKRYTENAEAYQDYARGIYFWNKRTEEGIRRSIKYFSDALEKDPGFALAQAMLADSCALVGYYQYSIFSRKEAYQKARAAASKALEMDESLA
jgi:TolB-like protein/DNA-binding winged helix-turn-helix (wHTH) protein